MSIKAIWTQQHSIWQKQKHRSQMRDLSNRRQKNRTSKGIFAKRSPICSRLMNDAEKVHVMANIAILYFQKFIKYIGKMHAQYRYCCYNLNKHKLVCTMNILIQFIIITQPMSYQISDQGIFEITKILCAQFREEKQMKQLNIDNLDQFKRMFIKPLYPHKQYMENNRKVIEKYDCDQYCCKLKPGRFCCCNSKPPGSEYKQFGLGVCLFVKFMKHLAFFMFFMTILSLVSIAAYQIVAIQTNYKMTQNYQSAFFSTTIGTVSSQFVKCQYSKIQPNNTVSFNLQCAVGQVNLLQPVLTNHTLSNLLNCRQQNMKYTLGQYSPDYSTISVTNQSLYNYDVSLAINSNAYNAQNVAYNYECINSKFVLGSVLLSSSNIVYITVAIDLFIIVCFILFMISEHKAQKKQVQYFKTRELAVHDFTVKLGGFHLNTYQKQLSMFIQEYDRIQGFRDPSKNSFFYDIVQVKIPQIQQLKQALENRRGCYEQLYDLMFTCFMDEEIEVNRYANSQDFIKKCYGNSNSPEYQEYKRILTELIQKFVESKKLKNLEDNIQISILMVLTNPKHKKQLIRESKNRCCGDYIKVGGTKYYISEAPVADLVIWQNKYKFTFIRVIFAWIITLGIVLCSYLLVAFAEYKKQQLYVNNKFNIDCNLYFTARQTQTWQQSLYDSYTQDKQSSYLHCYCNSNYFTMSFTDSIVRNTCSKWFSQYIVYYSIPILISFGIVVYNIIVSRIFRVLSRLQAHENLTSQLYSYIIKRSFMLIMNMGLIIILLKIHFKQTFQIDNLSFLFQGTYNDLTSDWYLEIGVIIILTLAFNIVIPIFDMIFVSFLKCLRKCWDKKCCCVKTSQKTKKGYIKLYANDLFPIQQRYSDFIALIVISLAFSGVMPILYVILFLSVWFMFICDKLLLFRVYQKPINYNEDLQNNVFKILYLAVMIHCVSTPFILSQKHLMSAGEKYQDVPRFNTILTTPYLIPYVVLFLILAFWAVFYSTIVKFCQYCSKKCEREVSKIYRSKLHSNFYKALSQYQINKLKMSIQLQMNTNVDQKNSILNQICKKTLNQLTKAEKQLVGNQRQDNIKLIGKAGYDEMFDDEIFFRQRKIKSLDYQLSNVFRKQRSSRNQGMGLQNTVAEINL